MNDIINITKEVNMVWNIANKLRGPYKSDKYKDTDSVKVSKKLFDMSGVKYKQYNSRGIKLEIDI